MKIGYGSDGGVDLTTIRYVKPGALHHAASALSKGAGELGRHREDYLDQVYRPVAGRTVWDGEVQPVAGRVTAGDAACVDGVHQRLAPAAGVLDGFARYLRVAKRKVDAIDRSAKNLHISVSDAGDVTVHSIPGEDHTSKANRHTSASVVHAEALAVIMATSHMDKKAAAALSRLRHGDVTSPPPDGAYDKAFWSQSFEEPSFWDDLTAGVKGFAIPPYDKGLTAFGLWALGKGLDFGKRVTDWRATLTYAHVVATEKGGVMPTKDAPWVKRAAWAMDKRNWKYAPKPGEEEGFAKWSKIAGRWGKVAGYGGTVVAFGTSAWSQWTRDASRSDLSTGDKIGRATYRGTAVAGGSWAGAEAGAVVGFAVGGPVGAVLGGAVGGVAGGVGGNYFADHTMADVPHHPAPDTVRIPTPSGASIRY